MTKLQRELPFTYTIDEVAQRCSLVMIRPDLLIIQVVARLTDILDEGDVQ